MSRSSKHAPSEPALPLFLPPLSPTARRRRNGLGLVKGEVMVVMIVVVVVVVVVEVLLVVVEVVAAASTHHLSLGFCAFLSLGFRSFSRRFRLQRVVGGMA